MNTTPTSITATTPSGLLVEMTLGEVWGRAQITRAAIPARGLAGAGSIFCPAAPGAPAGVTHAFGLGKAMIGFGADQAARIIAALAAKQAEIDATPARQAQRLREARAGLVADLGAVLDQAEAARVRAWERGDERRGVVSDELDAVAELHRANLAEFDRQHPEVLASIKAANTLSAEQMLGM